MPITQYRMINLIAAADNCFQALNTTLVRIDGICVNYRTGQRTAAECLAEIYDLVKPGPYPLIKPETIETLFTEKAHFTPSTIRFNDRVRDKQARRRGKEFEIPHNTFGGPPITTPPAASDSDLDQPTTRSPRDDDEGVWSPDEDLFTDE